MYWKTEYALSDNGDEFYWSDNQSEAMEEAQWLVDSGQYEEIVLVEIKRYTDDRDEIMLYSHGAWDC